MTRPKDVLIVEDEPVVRDAACRILLNEEISVDTASAVDEAVAILERDQFSVVLSDLMLPGSSGFDLLELIRSRWPTIEVVVITGYATLDNALTTFQKGAFDFVAKPFDIGELLGVVRRALRFSARRRESGAAVALAEPGRELEERVFFLGRHSWARLHPDGSATLGVAETFFHLLDRIERVELPAPEEHTTQGKLLARMLTPGDLLYLLWSPLSGMVLTINPRVRESNDLIDRDPFGEGWLIKIIPDNLDRELDLLDQRRFQRE